MPGPNDYNVVTDEEGNIALEPGLGRDEPSEEQRAGSRAAGLARMHAMKEELIAAGTALTERERAAAIKEQAIEKKQMELEARERALVAAEQKGKKP